MFKEFDGKPSVSKLEEAILKFWKDENIFEKTAELRKYAKPYIFYEGPPTANGKPGIHHILSRTIKDVILRYKTMTGHMVPRKAGWDTHGLPVEIAVEKKLGLTEKNQIDEFGVEKFNKACRDLVNEHINMKDGWRTVTDRMGYWLDLDDAYITYENDYIESVWWAIKQIFDKGLIYKGFKIVPQSPTIETPLSSHELSQNYKDVKDPNCYVKVKVLSSPLPSLNGAELLIWTTTPWTLLSNTAAAVGPDIDYVLVNNTRQLKQGDETQDETLRLVLAKSRLEVLDGAVEVLETFKGADVLGTKYEQIFDFLDLQPDKFPNVLTVLSGDFVSTEDGSGIVHMAPAFGQDDYEMSRLHNLPVLNPVSPGGRFLDMAGDFAGRTVKTFAYSDGHEEIGADKDIVIALKKAGKIYRSTNDYLHSYPHCWRTDNPVIYYARDSWFINSPAYKERMVALNKTINWNPKEIGSGRFGNWLEDVKEWSLSRDRYWGTPLPIWVSEDGEDMFAVGSVAELKEGLYERGDELVPVHDVAEEIDLHRPFVDRVVFQKDGKTYRRTPEIIDVWFDSGSMPFAQFHYPFENKELFESSFPADFIAEGVDQTRGWFYTLHNIAAAVFEKPAFRNIIVNDMILDKDGLKMSKRWGNIVNPTDIISQYGVDPLRWYLITMNNPWLPKRFDETSLKEVYRKYFDTFQNTYSFFALYANIDEFDPAATGMPVKERPEIDRWILSRLYTLVSLVRERMDDYDMTLAARPISDFLVDDVSNWYVRRNRRRFWKAGDSTSKLAAYQTLYEVLITVAKLTAPFVPFISEEIYRNLRTTDMPESIHMCDFPEVDAARAKLRDEALETRMSVVQRVVRSARSLRNDHRIRVRQPLSRLVVYTPNEIAKEGVTQMQDIVRDELNVKAVETTENVGELATLTAKADFKKLGPRFGKSMKMVANAIMELPAASLETALVSGSVTIKIDGNSEQIGLNELQLKLDTVEQIVSTRDNDLIIALDTEISQELEQEGIAREFVNRIQNLRKDCGLEVMDRIRVHYEINGKIAESIQAHKEYIQSEILAVELVSSLPDSGEQHQVSIDEATFSVTIEKIESK